jgi:hypothetical protein
MDKTIIVKVQGGLGNQLLQIIYAKALAKEFGIKKIYFTDYYFWMIFYPYKIHKYYPLMTEKLGIDFKRINPLLSLLLGVINRQRLKRVLNTFNKIFFFSSDNECDNYNGSLITVLDGFWHESKLIWKHRLSIRTWIFNLQDFKTIFLDKENKECVMHFRKGDYINNPHFKGLYHDLSILYYQNGLKYYNNNLEVRIVTDNPNWIEQNKSNFNFKFIINEGGIVSDLKSIINSEYKIIANSSFSLLGAYLSKSERVIFPSNWWGKKRKNRIYDTKKFPNTWQVMTDE